MHLRMKMIIYSKYNLILIDKHNIYHPKISIVTILNSKKIKLSLIFCQN